MFLFHSLWTGGGFCLNHMMENSKIDFRVKNVRPLDKRSIFLYD